jgi:L-asparaginase II
VTDEPRPLYAPLVQVRRGPIPESVHFGAWAVATREGNLVASLGDPGLLTYPRSALKAFQALPLVESGAADAFSLTPRHLALACASHRAEPFQVELVREWLGRLDLGPEALACGPAWPSGEADRDARVAAGEAVSPVFHNCSGKHAGLLSVCRHCHYSVHDYAHDAHPLQGEIRRSSGARSTRPASASTAATCRQFR